MNKSIYPKNWSEIRKNVLERDNFTCQHCGCKEGEIRNSERNKSYRCVLQVAHLDHDPENWEVNIDRLLSLCQSCHLKNDREHSQNLIQKAILQQRVKAHIGSDGMTKPQMKITIKSLNERINYLQDQIFARDLKIKTMKGALQNKADLSVELYTILVEEDLFEKDKKQELIATLRKIIRYLKFKKL